MFFLQRIYLHINDIMSYACIYIYILSLLIAIGLLLIPYDTYAVQYAGTVPDIPNMRHILTNIGHLFGHQSGQI